MPVYAADSAACRNLSWEDDWNVPGGSSSSALGFCQGNTLRAGTGGDKMDVSGVASAQFAGSRTMTVSEDLAPETTASLSKPAGWVLAAASYDLRFYRIGLNICDQGYCGPVLWASPALGLPYK